MEQLRYATSPGDGMFVGTNFGGFKYCENWYLAKFPIIHVHVWYASVLVYLCIVVCVCVFVYVMSTCVVVCLYYGQFMIVDNCVHVDPITGAGAGERGAQPL